MLPRSVLHVSSDMNVSRVADSRLATTSVLQRPSASIDDPHVCKINNLVRAKRRLTIRELAEACEISVGSCYEIFFAFVSALLLEVLKVKTILIPVTHDWQCNSQPWFRFVWLLHDALFRGTTTMRRGWVVIIKLFVAVWSRTFARSRFGWLWGDARASHGGTKRKKPEVPPVRGYSCLCYFIASCRCVVAPVVRA